MISWLSMARHQHNTEATALKRGYGAQMSAVIHAQKAELVITPRATA
jgi:hypothetical protein